MLPFPRDLISSLKTGTYLEQPRSRPANGSRSVPATPLNSSASAISPSETRMVSGQPGRVLKRFERTAARLGLPKISLYGLRHTRPLDDHSRHLLGRVARLAGGSGHDLAALIVG